MKEGINMNKSLFIVAALALTGCSSSQVQKPPLALNIKSKLPQPKQPKSALAYADRPVNPPLTKEEIKKAKGGLVWRKVPHTELSEDEKKDPNDWIGIDIKTGQVTSMMNP
jgi:hypothetical protein